MEREEGFGRMFAKRSAICMFVLFSMLLWCGMRLFVIATGDYGRIQAEQSGYSMPIGSVRGTIFDCNMVPLTNTEEYTVAAFSPSEYSVSAICSKGIDFQKAQIRLSDGKPAVCEVEGEISGVGVATATLYRNSNGGVARHLIGYTDSAGHGVSGLEAAYDDLLYFEQKPSAVFTVDAVGRVLLGVQPYFKNMGSPFENGVVTTIDVNIQNIVERAAAGIKSGAVIVCEAQSGKIRAAVSRPDFDPLGLEESLNAENSPLVNKTLSAFSVGSVFKPCVAAAVLEESREDFVYSCVGREQIADRIFKCHEHSGHGTLGLRSALAQSCNTYFFRLTESIGAERVYKMASTLNFGSAIRLAEGLYCARGNLTPLKQIDNLSAIANFSIGQGSLSLSPVALLPLYCAIANGGEYRLPSVVEATLSGGKRTPLKVGAKTRVMSKQTAKTLKDYLAAVITEGTGTAAAPKVTTAAGKTATAQTGRFDKNGREITNSWFCGMFPLENPRYVVVVMSEGAAEVTTAEVFSMIADGVSEVFDKE